jgi:hypothetical protein
MEVTSCAVSTALAPYLTLLIRFRAEPFACEQRRLELTHGQRETVDDRIRANVLIDAEHIEASIWKSLRCLAKAFPLTPRDTDVSWSLEKSRSGVVGDDFF